jgi:phage FluMu protein Com
MLIYPDNEISKPSRIVVWSLETCILEGSGHYCNLAGGDVKQLYGSSIYPKHATDVVVHNPLIDIHGYMDDIPQFYSMMNHGFDTVNNKFVRLLHASGITGYKLLPCRARIKGIEVINTIWIFKIVGSCGCCTRNILNGIYIKCTKCYKTTLLCPGCGVIQEQCNTCQQVNITYEGSSREATYKLCKLPPKAIVDQSAWDGSDMFASHGDYSRMYVTDKAKIFLAKYFYDQFAYKIAYMDAGR